jgi:3-hydroxybutyryl-CoA dehydrogenase
VDILVIGSAPRLAAVAKGIGQNWKADFWIWPSRTSPGWNRYDLIIDLEADERMSPAFSVANRAFWAFQAVKRPLWEILPSPDWQPRAVGVNLLPGFCERPLLEASAHSLEAENHFRSLLPDTDIAFVPDDVGMVSPRILSLILNEALLLSQETHTPLETIDLSVKLGLNYPRTIQEWGAWVGWRHVRDIVLALSRRYGADHYPIAQRLLTLAGLR